MLLVTKLRHGSYAIPGSTHTWSAARFAWTAVAIAACDVLALPFEGIEKTALSIIAVAGQLLVYIPLLSAQTSEERLFERTSGSEDTTVTLLARTIQVLTVVILLQTWVFTFTFDTVLGTLILAVSKACSWFFVAQTVRNMPIVILCTFLILFTG